VMLFVVEIKLEKYKEAIDDCTEVLKLEEHNSKGMCACLLAFRHACMYMCGE